jgi:hypothetical protein
MIINKVVSCFNKSGTAQQKYNSPREGGEESVRQNKDYCRYLLCTKEEKTPKIGLGSDTGYNGLLL